MSTTNFPGGVTSFGVPLYGMGGMPVPTRLGKVLFVHAGTGAGANDGLSADFPLATFDQAVNKCTNNAGDVIIGLPGHAESIVAAGGLDLDVIGVTVIGYGSGSNRPTITFTTATTADMDIDAANVTIVNLLFVAGIDALVAPIDVNAADFKMLNCETRDVAGSYQTVDFILTDDNCDRFVISGWKHTGDSAAGAETAISVIGGDDWVIEDFWIYGNFSVAAIENVTTAGNRVRIGGGAKPCFIWTENAADDGRDNDGHDLRPDRHHAAGQRGEHHRGARGRGDVVLPATSHLQPRRRSWHGYEHHSEHGRVGARGEPLPTCRAYRETAGGRLESAATREGDLYETRNGVLWSVPEEGACDVSSSFLSQGSKDSSLGLRRVEWQ
jgi:hypothetical protein